MKYRDAHVTMDYVLLSHLRTWAVMNYLILQPDPDDPDEYTLVIAPDHPDWNGVNRVRRGDDRR